MLFRRPTTESSDFAWEPMTAERPSRHFVISPNARMEQEFRKEVVEFWGNRVPEIENGSKEETSREERFMERFKKNIFKDF